MATQQTAIAQRNEEKLYFDHKDMDYYLSWVMGRQIYDGSDARECLETAARIRDGDAERGSCSPATFGKRTRTASRAQPCS